MTPLDFVAELATPVLGFVGFGAVMLLGLGLMRRI